MYHIISKVECFENNLTRTPVGYTTSVNNVAGINSSGGDVFQTWVHDIIQLSEDLNYRPQVQRILYRDYTADPGAKPGKRLREQALLITNKGQRLWKKRALELSEEIMDTELLVERIESIEEPLVRRKFVQAVWSGSSPSDVRWTSNAAINKAGLKNLALYGYPAAGIEGLFDVKGLTEGPDSIEDKKKRKFMEEVIMEDVTRTDKTMPRLFDEYVSETINEIIGQVKELPGGRAK